MIYYEVHENVAVLRAFRKALSRLDDFSEPNPKEFICKLEELNNMTIHGTMHGGNYWETTGFEFPDEESLTMFLLRWA